MLWPYPYRIVFMVTIRNPVIADRCSCWKITFRAYPWCEWLPPFGMPIHYVKHSYIFHLHFRERERCEHTGCYRELRSQLKRATVCSWVLGSGSYNAATTPVSLLSVHSCTCMWYWMQLDIVFWPFGRGYLYIPTTYFIIKILVLSCMVDINHCICLPINWISAPINSDL
jgi:hypothetical protein